MVGYRREDGNIKWFEYLKIEDSIVYSEYIMAKYDKFVIDGVEYWIEKADNRIKRLLKKVDKPEGTLPKYRAYFSVFVGTPILSLVENDEIRG